MYIIYMNWTQMSPEGAVSCSQTCTPTRLNRYVVKNEGVG